MNESGLSKHDQVLTGLVISLQTAAFQHLGKIKNPLTDAVERDLEQARGTIDILEMLKAKCRTDTHADVVRMLDGAVMDLQMNYLEERRKEQEQDRKADEDDASAGGEEAAGGEVAAAPTSGGSTRADAAQDGETHDEAASDDPAGDAAAESAGETDQRRNG